MLVFVVVNFSVMFTNFGHIHSVILIRSREDSSIALCAKHSELNPSQVKLEWEQNLSITFEVFQ